MTPQQARGIANWSCSMSMNCNQNDMFSGPLATGSNLARSNNPVMYSYVIPWDMLCKARYNGKFKLGHKKINGQKVCQYG